MLHILQINAIDLDTGEIIASGTKETSSSQYACRVVDTWFKAFKRRVMFGDHFRIELEWKPLQAEEKYLFRDKDFY